MLLNSVPGMRSAQLGENFYNSFFNAGQRSAIKQASAKLPFVGGFIQAGDAYNQAMDLYNNTGRASAYPGIYSSMPNLNQYMPHGVARAPQRDRGVRTLDQFYDLF